MPTQNATHALLQRFEKLPMGLALFSRAICFKAPYFASIKPRFDELRPGYARASIKKRRRVTNHLGTVHAIAMANLCEFVGGTLMEVSIDRSMRWIPKGMDIRYVAKATTDVTATCTLDHYDWTEKQDVWLSVEVHDSAGELVATADIPMYVSPRKTE
ncbi:MAG: hotdog fold domain-containing protein [Wenzhouxiangellaceae bacterium]